MRSFVAALALVATASAFTPTLRSYSPARNLAAASATRQHAKTPTTPSMLGVVITGGAAGVGFGYADEFLARRHSVVICDVKDPAAAVAALQVGACGGSRLLRACLPACMACLPAWLRACFSHYACLLYS